MRRYWKLAVLVPFIVLGISTYYVDASGYQPDYFLKTETGNAQVAANVQLQAYANPSNVSIGTRGSKYPSFWASLDANDYRNSLRDLVKEYPQFMRGKQNPNGFYVDHRVIGYANLESQGSLGISHVNVSVYSKQQKTSFSFTVPLPNTTSLNIGVLLRVMVRGKYMKIFTLNFNSNGDHAIDLYTLDLNQKRVVSDQTILSSANQVALGGVNYTDDLEQPSDYAVFTESRNNQPQPSLLLVYDTRSGKVFDIKNRTITNILKRMPSPAYAPNFQLDQLGNGLYVISKRDAKGQWRLVQYDLAKKNIRNDFTFSLNNSGGGVMNLVKISNHRLYMVVTSTASPTVNPSLDIVDLNAGKVLYQGVVMRKNNKELGGLGIYNISVS